MGTPFTNRWPLVVAVSAGCAASSLAFGQDSGVRARKPDRKPDAVRVTSLRYTTVESVVFNGVRYPAVAPAGDDTGVIYNNTAGPYNFLGPVTPDWRNAALDGFSFSPGPASGVSALLTSIDIGYWVATVPPSGTFDVALSFFNQMDGTATPVNSVPIPGVFGTVAIAAAGGYVSTFNLAGLPGGGIAIPDDIANGVAFNAFQTGTQLPQTGVSMLFANGAAGAGLPPTVGGSAPGVWADQNQDTVFAGDEGVILVGVTNASNLYVKFTGTYTPTALGACCRADGTCTPNQNSAQCATLGGNWAGANVTCAAANCPAPGACCVSAGVCLSTILPICVAQSGVFSGVGTTCPPTPACVPQYWVDDTTGEVQQGFGSATATEAWLNRFTVANNLSTITTILVAFGDNTPGGLNGTPVTVYLWSDPNNDGDPADAVVLASATGVVANSGAATLNPFPITPTSVGPNGTNFFVGAILTATPPTPGIYAALLDNTTNQGRSWFAGNTTGAAIGPTNLGAALINGNFLIRADGTAGGGGGCYANCDASTTAPVLNVADFTCFLTKFAGNVLPYANCDSSTTAPVLNVADFTCFLTKFAGGCP